MVDIPDEIEEYGYKELADSIQKYCETRFPEMKITQNIKKLIKKKKAQIKR